MNDRRHDSRTPYWPVWARWRPEGLALALHVRPGARKTALVGEHGQRLKIALHAPPVDGKANEELLQFLAKLLALRRSRLRLLAGAASKEKTVLIEIDEKSVLGLLAQLAPQEGERAD
ncbi:MAG TPA: DUF167 domain-containing protein [Burkholderiaceae bacterium]|nr:DUF167 domain-containing protein [Burkholderiaceae bacterium]